ncbi:histidine kinase [Clostridium minihomine]|uniref:histidine kinase n=1 Tax=Clostridium minihomine TaxID=2045012 RepID=UPI000C7931BF|nr:histidine kinase [Clostridium minihomine]
MNNRSYTITIIAGAVMVLIGYNLLNLFLPNEAASSTFGIMLTVVFALFLSSMGRKKPKG